MSTQLQSPRILEIEWGKIEVDGVGICRDAKLYPGGGREWDWRETGTRHVPGVQPTDVEELLEQGSKVIVLTRGMELRLQTCPETIELLKQRNIPFHIEETKAAVEIYNKLVDEGAAVGGLFHSTC